MIQPGRPPDGEPTEYGYGFAVSYLDGHHRVTHVGGMLGFSGQIAHYDDDEVTIAVLTNTEGANAARIESDIARIVLGLGEQSTKDILLAPEELERYTGTYDLGLTTVDISESGGRLEVRVDAPGLEGRYLLLHQGAHSFQARSDPQLEIRFSPDDDPAGSFVLVRHGITLRGRRIR
jgi:hypothetical protein